MAGGSISADPLLNLISGRTAMLKKELVVEKKESYMRMLEKMFAPEYFIKTLQLPLGYIKGFEYYVVENKSFTKILDQKNKTTIEFLLGELAVKYKDIIPVKKNNVFLFYMFLMSQFVMGQTFYRKEIHGKITVDSITVDVVSVINGTTKKSTISNREGDFSIEVREGDILIFSAVNLMSLEVIIQSQDIISGFLNVAMKTLNVQLKEVVVKESTKLTAESLGIIPYGQKKYTQAERRLKTAGDFKPIMLLGLLGGSLELDPIINKINGKTKRLKKIVELEQKENNLKLLDSYFEEKYFIDKLEIPVEYVNGFKYYIVENKSLLENIKYKNNKMVDFLIIELANDFKNSIACEKE